MLILGSNDKAQHLLERRLDLAALLQPCRHGKILRAHEFRIEQF